MFKSRLLGIAVVAPFIIALSACQNLPGTRNQQGTVIGGAAGAATGAAIAKNNRLLGALVGGALGAGGGYLIAANSNKIAGNDQAAASQAVRKAQENPATPEDARRAMTADLNLDGFVTLDEVVAMKEAGFSDDQMLQRMRATDQVFELTDDQKNYLASHGISQYVIDQMTQLNRQGTAANPNERRDVISSPTGR